MIILIDGPSGSGKTTLAHRLHEEYVAANQSCEVISMDSIYEGWDDALSPSLVENLQNWVIDPYLRGEAMRIHTWDWATNARAAWATIPHCDVLILEGVGSAHTSLRKHADRIIWVEGNADVLLNRVLERDGQHIRAEMIKWQVREREYFIRENVRESATEVVTT